MNTKHLTKTFTSLLRITPLIILATFSTGKAANSNNLPVSNNTSTPSPSRIENIIIGENIPETVICNKKDEICVSKPKTGTTVEMKTYVTGKIQIPRAKVQNSQVFIIINPRKLPGQCWVTKLIIIGNEFAGTIQIGDLNTPPGELFDFFALANPKNPLSGEIRCSDAQGEFYSPKITVVRGKNNNQP